MAHMDKWVQWLILKIEMGHLEGWGTWAMEHMGKGVLWLILNIEMGYLGGWTHWLWGNGAHGQCGHVLDHVQLP